MEIYYNAQALDEIRCAGFVIKSPDNKICLVKSKSGGKYSFPKGKYEKKKDGKGKNLLTLYTCAKRELVEETQMFNYEFATTQTLSELYLEKSNILYFPAVITNKLENFQSTFCTNDEIDQVLWLSQSEIKQIPSDEIKDIRKLIALTHLKKDFTKVLDICEVVKS